MSNEDDVFWDALHARLRGEPERQPLSPGEAEKAFAETEPVAFSKEKMDRILEGVRKVRETENVIVDPVGTVIDLLAAFTRTGSEALVRLYHALGPTPFGAYTFGSGDLLLRESTHVWLTNVDVAHALAWKPKVAIDHPGIRFHVHSLARGDASVADGIVSIDEGGVVHVEGGRYHADGAWRLYLLCTQAELSASSLPLPVELFALRGTGESIDDSAMAIEQLDELTEAGYLAHARARLAAQSVGDQRLAISLLGLYGKMQSMIAPVENEASIDPRELGGLLNEFASAGKQIENFIRSLREKGHIS